jgi:hypothetical protein
LEAIPTAPIFTTGSSADRGEAVVMEMARIMKTAGYPNSSRFQDWLITQQRGGFIQLRK